MKVFKLILAILVCIAIPVVLAVGEYFSCNDNSRAEELNPLEEKAWIACRNTNTRTPKCVKLRERCLEVYSEIKTTRCLWPEKKKKPVLEPRPAEEATPLSGQRPDVGR